MFRFLFFTIFTFFSVLYLSAQQFTVGIKLTGLSIHPAGATNASLMKYKLDENGVFVFNPGIRLGFEYFFYKNIASIKIEQGLYLDCANQFAGFTHIGLRGRIFQIEKHSLNGGIGPTFFFRKNWYKLDRYNDAYDIFKGNPEDNWQWNFFWWGGEFEYNYKISETMELSTSIVPFIPPYVPLIMSFGLRAIKDK
jgi:hypothetical protein